jgi:hypothetical protein
MREGPSIEWVRANLAREGAREIVVHSEDILSTEGRDLAGESVLEPQPANETLRHALRKWGLVIGLLVAFDAYRCVRQGLAALTHWTTALTVAVTIGAVLAVSPVWLFAEVQWASVRHDWRRVLRLLPWLERNPLLQIPAMKYNFGSIRAKALAGLGRLDEGLAIFDRVAPRSGMSSGAQKSARSAVFVVAHRYEEVVRLRREAVAEDPKCAIDAASGLLRYGGDPEEARAILDGCADSARSVLEQMFYDYARGLLEQADGHHQEALERLERAHAMLRLHLAHMPSTQYGLGALFDGLRALSLAKLGRSDEARALLARHEAYLRVADEEPLVERVRTAIHEAENADAEVAREGA